MSFIPLSTVEVVNSQNKLIYWVMMQNMGEIGFKGLFGDLNLRTSRYSRGLESLPACPHASAPQRMTATQNNQLSSAQQMLGSDNSFCIESSVWGSD